MPGLGSIWLRELWEVEVVFMGGVGVLGWKMVG